MGKSLLGLYSSLSNLLSLPFVLVSSCLRRGLRARPESVGVRIVCGVRGGAKEETSVVDSHRRLHCSVFVATHHNDSLEKHASCGELQTMKE